MQLEEKTPILAFEHPYQTPTYRRPTSLPQSNAIRPAGINIQYFLKCKNPLSYYCRISYKKSYIKQPTVNWSCNYLSHSRITTQFIRVFVKHASWRQSADSGSNP
jgi:hypothetical protein